MKRSQVLKRAIVGQPVEPAKRTRVPKATAAAQEYEHDLSIKGRGTTVVRTNVSAGAWGEFGPLCGKHLRAEIFPDWV